MGMKARSGRILDLARQFQEAEAAYQSAQSQLESAAADRQKAWEALVAAGPEKGAAAARRAAGVAAPAAAAPRAAGRNRGRRRRSRDFYSELQQQLHSKMKAGVKYTGPELQALVDASDVSDQTFTKRVRGPLVDDARIKKAWAEKGNTSPVNVRWVKG